MCVLPVKFPLGTVRGLTIREIRTRIFYTPRIYVACHKDSQKDNFERDSKLAFNLINNNTKISTNKRENCTRTVIAVIV